VLGRIIEDPVTERHPTNPLSLYGAHKLVAEKYHYMYFKDYGYPRSFSGSRIPTVTASR